MPPMEDPEPLYVTCKKCTRPVPTGVGLTGRIYEVPLSRGYELTCPTCGAVTTYTKAEFHILTT